MSRPRHYSEAARQKRTPPSEIAPEQESEGPRVSYGCACVSRDARDCLLIRYDGHSRYPDDPVRDVCECMCHQWSDDEPKQEQEKPE